jgi:hypothetical protein
MKRAASLLTAVFVVLLPFGWPTLPWNTQLSDLVFPVLCVAIIAAGWRTAFHWLDAFVAAFLLGSLASLPASHWPQASALGLVKEAYGAAIYVAIAIAATEIGAERVCGWFTRSVVTVCLLSLAAAAVFYATNVNWQPLGEPGVLPYIGTAFRIWGLAIGPELLGNALTFAVPLILLEARQRSTAARTVVAACLVSATEVMTFSLSIAGFAVSLVMGLWPILRSHRIVRFMLAGGARDPRDCRESGRHRGDQAS